MGITLTIPSDLGRVRKVRQALSVWRPVSYSGVAAYLKDYLLYQFVAELWRELWGDPLPDTGNQEWMLNRVEALQGTLMNRVNDEFFPVDLEWYDMSYQDWLQGDYEEEDEEYELRPASFHPILYRIRIEAQGFDWPWGFPLSEMGAAWAEPLAHALALHEFEHGYEISTDTLKRLRRDARKWWQAHGFSKPPTLPWLDAPGPTIVQLLEALPSPFNGLGTVYHLLTRKSGNAFLDTGDEDAWATSWGWTKQDILFLAKQHLESLPILARRDAFRDWFDEQDDKEEATQQIIQMLVAPPLSVTLVTAEERGAS